MAKIDEKIKIKIIQITDVTRNEQGNITTYLRQEI